MEIILSVTGHRPDKLGGYRVPNPTYIHVVNGLRQAFEHYKPDGVIVGMALGVDQWAAELCLTMGIPFHAAIPFEGQESRWPGSSQAKYHWLLSRAASKHIICEGGYHPAKMHTRNAWMVDHSGLLVAAWNGTDGGTAACVGYAQKVKKPIYFIPLDPPKVPAASDFFNGGQSAIEDLGLIGLKKKEEPKGPEDRSDLTNQFKRKVSLD